MKANRSWVRDKLKKLWQWKFVFCLSRAQETSDRAHSKILGSRLFHDELQIDDNNLNRRILAASLFRKRLRLRDEVPSRPRRFPATTRSTRRHPTRRGRVWWRQDLRKRVPSSYFSIMAAVQKSEVPPSYRQNFSKLPTNRWSGDHSKGLLSSWHRTQARWNCLNLLGWRRQSCYSCHNAALLN